MVFTDRPVPGRLGRSRPFLQRKYRCEEQRGGFVCPKGRCSVPNSLDGDPLQAHQLLTFIDPQNHASRNVLNELGFELVEHTRINGHHVELCDLTI